MAWNSADWDLYVKSAKSSAAAYQKMYRDEEEERLKKEAQRVNDELINKQIESGELNKDGSEKNVLQKTGDFFGGTAKGMVDSAVDRVNSWGDLVGRTYEHVTGIKQARDDAAREELNKTNRERSEIMAKLWDENGNDTNISADERAKLERQLKGLGNVADSQVKGMQDVKNADKEALDTRKHLTNAAETALDVATAGFGASVIKGAAKQVAKTAFKQGAKETTEQVVKQGALKTAGKNLAAGASLGAAYSGIDTARDPNATVEDYAKNMAVGAGVGGGLGVVGATVLGGLSKGIARLNAAKSADEVAAATNELVKDAKEPQKQLGAGYRDTATIKGNMARLQNGEDVSVYKYVDSDGNDVTSQVIDFDKEIKARESAIRDLDAQAQGIDNNTGKASIPEGVDPSEYTGDTLARNNTAQAVEKLTAEVQDLKAKQEKAFQSLGGVSREIDTELANKRFSELRDEMATSVEYNKNVQSAATREMAQSIDVKALEKEAADLNAGNIPDKYIKEFRPAQTVDDVQSMMKDVDPTDKTGFTAGSREIIDQKITLNNELNNLFTRERYEENAKAIDAAYFRSKQEILALPEPLQPQKLDELNEKLLRDYDEIEGLMNADAEQVAKVQSRMEENDALEQAMVQEARALQLSDPETFRPIDNTAVQDRLREIESMKAMAQDAQYEDAKAVVQDIQDVGMDLKQAAKESPVVSRSVDKIAEVDTMGLPDNTGKTAGLGWIVGIPSSVLRRFGKTGSEISDILTDAVQLHKQMDGQYQLKMEDWGKLIKGKDGTEKVARALDGDTSALESLSKNQTQAYTEIKAWFKDLADKQGIPENARIKDYLPHLFEGKNFDTMEQTIAYLRAGKKDGVPLTESQIIDMENSLAGIDANTQAHIASMNSYTTKNGFLKKRKGKEDYSLDLEKIMGIYHSKASADIAYKPAIEAANALTPNLTKEQNTYVNAVFKALQGETDTVIERSLDGALSNLSSVTGRNLGGAGTTSRLSKGARNAIYNATIGGNVGSSVRNTQQFFTHVYAEVGAQKMLEAAPQALSALKKGTAARQEVMEMGIMSSRQGSYLQGGAMPKFKDKSTRALWGMFNTTEGMNRATAYFAAKAKHLDKFPGDIEGAKKYGAEVAKKANFDYSAMDIPIAMQGDMAKNFLQMQTYNVQNAHYIKNLLGEGLKLSDIFTKNSKGKYEMNLEPQLKLARFIGGNALFFGTIGSATGMAWEEAVPFYNDIKAGEVPRSPMYQTIFGDGKANKGLVGSIASGTGALFSGDWEQAGKDADALARGVARTFVPAGNQIVKTAEGAASAVSGMSTTGSGITDTIDKGVSALSGNTPGGNIRFMQGTDAWSKFKATVLGQYSTQEGRDWVQDGMKNVPAGLKINGIPASQYIKQLPRQNQEQYVSYYSTKSGASDAVKSAVGASRSDYKDRIVSGLRDGTISENEAIRLSVEYNQQVVKAMSSFLQGNRNIPSRLYEDLSQNMMMNYQSNSNSAKRTPSLAALEKELGFAIDDTGEEMQE